MPSDSPSPRWSRATLCVHGGHRPGPVERAVVAPLARTATWTLDDAAYALRAAGRAERGRVYARETNPTVEVLERHVAALEGAARALAFASGMAALHALLLATLRRGDRLVAARELYGGTSALLAELLPRLDVELVPVDPGDASALRAALAGGARLVLVESLSNPSLSVCDLPAVAAACRDAGALLAVDATFASPVVQRPIEHGADVVHHSATKYLGGHSDAVGGVLAFREDGELARACWRWRTHAGGCLDPEAAWLVDRGLKTLALRVRAQSETASRLARLLAETPGVERVLHPSLPDHPTRAVAERVLDLPGGMLSFVVGGGDEAALGVVRRLRLVLEAASLGGVESLASVPATLSHSDLPPEERRAAGVEPGLVRLSVGVEDADDLAADLRAALGGAA